MPNPVSAQTPAVPLRPWWRRWERRRRRERRRGGGGSAQRAASISALGRGYSPTTSGSLLLMPESGRFGQFNSDAGNFQVNQADRPWPGPIYVAFGARTARRRIWRVDSGKIRPVYFGVVGGHGGRRSRQSAAFNNWNIGPGRGRRHDRLSVGNRINFDLSLCFGIFRHLTTRPFSAQEQRFNTGTGSYLVISYADPELHYSTHWPSGAELRQQRSAQRASPV